MPHPAINIDVMSRSDVRYHAVHTSGYDPGWKSVANQYLFSRSLRWEPASTKNPVRADGTRAPAPYEIRRITVQNSGKRNWTQANPGTAVLWGYYMKEVNRPPLVTHQALADTWTVVRDTFLYPALAMTNVDSRARTAFLLKLGEASGKDAWELGVMAGEIRETAGLTKDLAVGLKDGILKIARSYQTAPHTVAKFLDTIRKYGKKEAANRVLRGDTALAENIVKSWLVVQFGIRPLLDDIYNGTVYLSAAQQADPGLTIPVTVRGGASDDENDVYISHGDVGLNGATYAIDGLYRQACEVHYSAVYKIPTRGTPMQQLGLYNPMFVTWELVRFSWMIDYVVGIGDWLKSLMAAQGTSFVEGSKSTVRRTSLLRYRQRTSAPGSGGPIQGFNPDDVPLVQIDHFVRTVLGSGVTPAFLPGVRSKLGISEMANSLAALTTLVGARQSGGPWFLRR